MSIKAGRYLRGTHGKRYTGRVTQRAWEEHGKARADWVRKTGDAPSDSQVPPPKGEFRYVEEGTHGQIYSNYTLAPQGVTTPKKAGRPPPGSTSKRPVEDKPPTSSDAGKNY